VLQGVGAVQRIIQLQLYVADYIVVTPFGLNGRAQQRCRARDERDHDVEKSDTDAFFEKDYYVVPIETTHKEGPRTTHTVNTH